MGYSSRVGYQEDATGNGQEGGNDSEGGHLPGGEIVVRNLSR